MYKKFTLNKPEINNNSLNLLKNLGLLPHNMRYFDFRGLSYITGKPPPPRERIFSQRSYRPSRL